MNFKSRYQNVYLTEQVKQLLQQIQQLDFDRSCELTSVMVNPPEILKFKEPLLRLASRREDSNSGKIYSMQNLDFTLNIR